MRSRESEAHPALSLLKALPFWKFLLQIVF